MWCPNKHGGRKDEPFLIGVVPGISIVVRIFRPVTVIKEQDEMFLIKKKKKQKNGTRE